MKSMKSFLCELYLLLTCQNTIVCFIFQMDPKLRGVYKSGKVLVPNKIIMENGYIREIHLWIQRDDPLKVEHLSNLFFLQLSKDRLLAFGPNQTRFFKFRKPDKWLPRPVNLISMIDPKASELFFQSPPVPQNETTITHIKPYSHVSTFSLDRTITLIESFNIIFAKSIISSEKIAFRHEELKDLEEWRYTFGFNSGNASYLLGYRVISRRGTLIHQNVIIQMYIGQSIHTYAEIVEEIKSEKERITLATYVALPNRTGLPVPTNQGQFRDGLWIVRNESQSDDPTYMIDMDWLVQSFQETREACSEGRGETLLSTIQNTSRGCNKTNGKYPSAKVSFKKNFHLNRFRGIKDIIGFSVEYIQRIIFFYVSENEPGLYYFRIAEYAFQDKLSYEPPAHLYPLKQPFSLSYDLYNVYFSDKQSLSTFPCPLFKKCDACNIHSRAIGACAWDRGKCTHRPANFIRTSCYSIDKVISYDSTSPQHGVFTIELKNITNQYGIFIAQVFLLDDRFKLIECSVLSFTNSTIEGELTDQKDGNYGVFLSIRYFRYEKSLEPLTFNWTRRHFFYARSVIPPSGGDEKLLLITLSLLTFSLLVLLISWCFLVHLKSRRPTIIRKEVRNILVNLRSRLSRKTYQASGYVSNMFAPGGPSSSISSSGPSRSTVASRSSRAPSKFISTEPSAIEDKPLEVNNLPGKPPSNGKTSNLMSKIGKALFSRSTQSLPRKR